MFHVCPTYVTDEKGIRLPSIYVPYMFHVCPTYITDEKGTRLPGYRPYISYVPYMFHVCPTYVPYTRERDRENTLNWAAQFRVLVSSCWWVRVGEFVLPAHVSPPLEKWHLKLSDVCIVCVACACVCQSLSLSLSLSLSVGVWVWESERECVCVYHLSLWLQRLPAPSMGGWWVWVCVCVCVCVYHLSLWLSVHDCKRMRCTGV
jgi:hypothetical protein